MEHDIDHGVEPEVERRDEPATEPADTPNPQTDPTDTDEKQEPDASTPDDAPDVLRAERDQYLDALQRSQADFTNYRRRSERDRQAARDEARASVVRELLPLIDAIDSARRHDDVAALLWGLAVDVLARVDVERLAPDPGEPFDPELHAAVSTTADDDATGELVVVELQRPGYVLAGGRVLRAAEVVAAHRRPPQGDDIDEE